MRNRQNLKKFDHVSKNTAQRQGYKDMVTGPQMRGGTTDDKSDSELEETTTIRGKVGDSEPIPKKSSRPKAKPYRSPMTVLYDNWLVIVVTAVLGLAGWAALTLIDHKATIATHATQIEAMSGDASKLREEFSVVRDRSLQTETLLQAFEKQINRFMRNAPAQQ